MTEVRKCAMSAMDNMDTYLHSKNPKEKWESHDKLKKSLSLLALFTGLTYTELYDTLSITDLSNYNLTWLRTLQINKAIREGKRIRNKEAFFARSWEILGR